MRFKKKILKNGLRLMVIPVKDAPSVTVVSMVEVGSEYESEEKNGISHFLEHMFFKGTNNRPTSLAISKEFDGMGAEHNAFTGNEMTAYYGKSAKRNYEKVLNIITDMYLNPTFPEAEMEKEKGVIIEEINMYEDMPHVKVHRVFQNLLYGNTPHGWSILGPAENIKKMKRDDFVEYRKAHYVAPKTLVVVAGDVDTRDALKKMEKAFKDIPVGKVIGKPKLKETQTEPKIEIVKKDSDQTHIVIGFRTFDIYDKRTPVLKLLSTILGGGMSSRLFQKMREELGICYYIRSGVNDLTDHGNFTVSAGVDKSRIEEAVSGILGELRKIAENGVPEEELRKAQDYLIGNTYLNLETSDSLAIFYGVQEIMREKVKNPIELEKEIYGITSKDVQKLAKQIFVNEKMNMAIVGNISNSNRLKEAFKI